MQNFQVNSIGKINLNEGAPVRPNPIALTAVEVIQINLKKGVIQISWIDAHDGRRFKISSVTF